MAAQNSHGLGSIVSAFQGVAVSIFAISGVVNLLALTGSLYMLQVYDRVLTSHSVPTLVAFSILAAGLYVFQGALDILRTQILVRLGIRLDRRISPIAHDALLRLPLRGVNANDAQRPVRDVETVRAFLSGPAPVAVFDLPWMPLYLAFVYFLHPWLGILATVGLLVLVSLTALAEWWSRDLSAQAAEAGMRRGSIADGNARHAEVLHAMGFGDRASARFAKANEEYVTIQSRTSDIVGGLSGLSRVFRMLLQSAILGAGAFLTLQGEVSAGAIIAASIAASRALAPVELAIGQWKAFIAARQAFKRLRETVEKLPDRPTPMELPPPGSSLKLENVFLPVFGQQKMILNNVSFELKAGDALGLIGPSGSGKSTLVRAITGVWPIARGAIRLDGAGLDRWPLSYFAKSIGYLPQEVSLMDGTIAENIARFEPDADSRDIIRAAQAAGVHEMILRLPEGYETQLGVGGAAMSAGQRQRVALARALYGEPFLVVLDEPNSNLDSEGEAALTQSIVSVRKRGGIVIVVAHRPSALQATNLVAFVRDGQLQKLGPRDEVLREILQRPAGSAS